MLATNCGDGTRGRVAHIDTFRFRESLEVHTDAGLLGLGESYFGATLVEACVDEVAHHYLLSKHPLHIGEHAKELNGYLGYSSSGTQTRGDWAIDIALRDLFGKITVQPVYRLLVVPRILPVS
jgi:galactonate dehydratase